jgi:hypothetical protein
MGQDALRLRPLNIRTMFLRGYFMGYRPRPGEDKLAFENVTDFFGCLLMVDVGMLHLHGDCMPL